MNDARARAEIIYNEYRTLELNKRYYAKRMARKRVVLRRIDIFLALFAASSGVAGFGLWNTQFQGYQVGPMAFAILTGMAIVIGIARPYMKMEDELERLSAIQGTYDSLTHVLSDMVSDIKVKKNIDASDDKAFAVIRQLRGTLGAKEDKPADRRLIEAVQSEVNELYPVTEFWWPPADKP